MAIDFETLKTRPVYDGGAYLSMLRRLLPLGPIWGFLQRLTGELLIDIPWPGNTIEDAPFTGQPEAIQDIITGTSGEASDSILGRFFSVLGSELARLEARAWYLLQESTPGLSVELLTDWEAEAGLPDSCTGSLALTVEERQIQVHQKLFGENQTITVEYLEDYALNFGFDITVDEGGVATEPFICGVAICGRNRLGGFNVVNQLTIYVHSGTGNLQQLQCIFKKIIPAHLIVIWVDER